MNYTLSDVEYFYIECREMEEYYNGLVKLYRATPGADRNAWLKRNELDFYGFLREDNDLNAVYLRIKKYFDLLVELCEEIIDDIGELKN